MNLQQQTVLTQVTALVGTLTEADKAAVLKDLIAQHGKSLSAKDRAALLGVLPEGSEKGMAQVSITPTSFATKIDDSTFAFKVPGDPKLSQESHINAKLGADAPSLISGLKSIGVQLDRTVPEHSMAVLSKESNDKTYAKQKELYADGLASPYEAVNIAMEAVCAAKQAGIELGNIRDDLWEDKEDKALRVESEALVKGLGEGTATVLKMLTAGVVRFDNGSRSGALGVGDDGRLCADDFYGHRSGPSFWAFGASPSAESK
jgi:hypothetical protein